MPTELLDKLYQTIIGGGQGAIIAIFMALSLFLGWYIIRLEKTVKKKDDRLDEVVDNYHKSILALTETINQLKLMFYEIRTKI